jgi:hypothetical protein
MRLTIFLSALLCLVFIFRMCFLSFGGVNTPAISYHRSISFKRKLSGIETACAHGLQEKNIKTDLTFELGTLTNKAIQNKRLKIALLLLISEADCNILPKIKDNLILNDRLNQAYLSEKKYLSFSILRI